jgi:hypothetical protein
LLHELKNELRFLTAKPVIYVANTDECGIVEDNPHIKVVHQVARELGAQAVTLCAKMETEIQGLPPEEQKEFMELAGETESGLGQVIRKSFELLGLVSFFTKNENEVRAWEVPKGSTAPRAAGTIHTDFERGFIRAEVVPFETFAHYGSDAAVKAAGKMRLEGREYVVQDGDVIYFRFNV